MPAAKKAAAKPAKARTNVAATVARVETARPPAPANGKAGKAKKPKLVRDSFTIPKNEYEVLEGLKVRAAKLGQPVKKSELLRAGVAALAAMQDPVFLANVTAVPALKTGRPAKA